MGIDVTLERLAGIISSRRVADSGFLVLMDTEGPCSPILTPA